MRPAWVKSGKNLGGYLGECIDIAQVLREIEVAARTHGWSVETLLDAGGQRMIGLARDSRSGEAGSLYLSTGIHGDEPAGPLVALRLLRENQWPEGLSIRFCPCLNPRAFVLNRRENPEGVDLNRDYQTLRTAEIRAHTQWLERQPTFDFALCLHEDWESQGFYLYELNPDGQPSLADAMICRIGEVCPVDHSETIEGRPAMGGIIRPAVDARGRPDWPEAFYLIQHKTRLSYTLEAPSDYALAVRVEATVAGVSAALKEFLRLRGGRGPLFQPRLAQ